MNKSTGGYFKVIFTLDKRVLKIYLVSKIHGSLNANITNWSRTLRMNPIHSITDIFDSLEAANTIRIDCVRQNHVANVLDQLRMFVSKEI